MTVGSDYPSTDGSRGLITVLMTISFGILFAPKRPVARDIKER
jgi:hypothetical protein